MKAPEQLETARLLLRRPTAADAEPIFTRFAADPEVTRYVAFPRHHSVADAEAFLAFSDASWSAHPAGPYLIFSRADGALLGSTGLHFESSDCTSTGYVLARDAWGKGYATEALGAMIALARSLSLKRLCADCHTAHHASVHVLEKSGFIRAAVLPEHRHFPNLNGGAVCDVFLYGIEP